VRRKGSNDLSLHVGCFRWRIAWSFFAGSMGAWAITSPPNYAVQSGWIGMLSYAVSCGIPTIFIVTLGNEIQERWPEANSLADFVSLRCIFSFFFSLAALMFLGSDICEIVDVIEFGSLRLWMSVVLGSTLQTCVAIAKVWAQRKQTAADRSARMRKQVWEDGQGVCDCAHDVQHDGESVSPHTSC
jgi:hypothetical protein